MINGINLFFSDTGHCANGTPIDAPASGTEFFWSCCCWKLAFVGGAVGECGEPWMRRNCRATKSFHVRDLDKVPPISLSNVGDAFAVACDVLLLPLPSSCAELADCVSFPISTVSVLPEALCNALFHSSKLTASSVWMRNSVLELIGSGVVGVCGDDSFAFGMQVVNLKTFFRFV